MARFTQAEVLRRYQAGERDFRGADLRCLRFRGATLAGADFSGADLRGTDFLEADLRGAQFNGANCGLPLMSRLCVEVIAMGIIGAVGLNLETRLTQISVYLFAGASGAPHYGVDWKIALAFFLFTFTVAFAWQGFNAIGLAYLVAAIAITTVACATGDIGLYLPHDQGFVAVSPFSPFFFSAVFAVSLAVSIALWLAATASCLLAIREISTSLDSIAAAIIGIGITVVLSALYQSESFDGLSVERVTTAYLTAVSCFVPGAVLGMIAYMRTLRQVTGYLGARKFGIKLASLGATSFSGANLYSACFVETHLAFVSFADSRRQASFLDHVCWKEATGLQLACLGTSILANPRCRQLLQSGSAPGVDLHGLNLRGAYLPEADLRGADLRETNLSEAVLTEAHLENANLKASQCLGTDLAGAHLTGATLEGWNIDHATKLVGVDCAYVYLLEPFDALGQRRDDHHRERLPHDPDKSFGPGDFETYFKKLIEEVKLLIKNGVDARAFQQAFQEVMRQHPQITPESVTGLKRSGNDVLVTLQAPASVDKGAVEQTFFDKYNAVKMEKARLHGLLEAERRVSEVERERATQFAELASRLVPAANPSPHPTTVVNTTTIHTGDGNLINTGSLNTAGGLVNLGDLSDQARLTIEAIPDQRPVEGQPSLRQLLQELKACLDADSHLPETSRFEALAEIKELATAAQDPKKNGGPARRAINALKGLSAGLSETNKAVAETSKLVGAVKTLLPLIAGFFLG